MKLRFTGFSKVFIAQYIILLAIIVKMAHAEMVERDATRPETVNAETIKSTLKDMKDVHNDSRDLDNQPVQSIRKRQYKSDPLGQQPRLNKSIPSVEYIGAVLPNSKDEYKNIIKKVQLTLYLENIYLGDVNGEMNETTKEALRKYKETRGIMFSEKLLDEPTLTSLGVIGVVDE